MNSHMPRSQEKQFSIWYLLLTLVLLMTMQYFFLGSQVERIPYSQFKSLVKNGLVTNLIIEQGSVRGEIKAEGMKQVFSEEKLKQIGYDGKGTHPFTTIRVEDPGLTTELEAAGIPFRGEVSSNWLPTLLSWIVPVALFFLFWSYLMKRMGGGGAGLMQIGKSKAKVYIEKKTGVTFADVEGHVEDQPLGRVAVRVDDDRAVVQLLCARGDRIRRRLRKDNNRNRQGHREKDVSHGSFVSSSNSPDARRRSGSLWPRATPGGSSPEVQRP